MWRSQAKEKPLVVVLQSQLRINPLLLIKVAFVGDSRNYPCRDTNPLVQLTRQAMPTQLLVDCHIILGTHRWELSFC